MGIRDARQSQSQWTKPEKAKRKNPIAHQKGTLLTGASERCKLIDMENKQSLNTEQAINYIKAKEKTAAQDIKKDLE